MNDITDRLRRWAISTDAVPASDLMDDAADAIESLRREVLEQRTGDIKHGGGWSDREGVIYRPPTLTDEDCISPNGHLMTSAELTNRLRLLSGYHLGSDLVERLTAAERFQREQREALAQAADRIEQLEAELAKAKAETHSTAHLCG